MPKSEQPLNIQDRGAMLDEILERVANEIGDITSRVVDQYYSRHPNARQRFTELSLGQAEAMEAEMVESALYCVMNWYEQPLEVEILFANYVPHHENLEIPLRHFTGLQAAVMDILDSVVRDEEPVLKSLLSDLRSDLIRAIERSSERSPQTA